MFTIRPIAATDEAAYVALLDGTSSEDRYCRFFHVVDHFDPLEVHRFVEPRTDTIGLIAHSADRTLGTVHAVGAGEGEAEVAIVVAPEARHRGVGAALMAALVAEARSGGLRRLTAVSFRENAGFAKLALGCGMQVATIDGVTLHWALDLTSEDALLETGTLIAAPASSN